MALPEIAGVRFETGRGATDYWFDVNFSLETA